MMIPSKKANIASLSKWIGGILLSIFLLFQIVEYFTKPASVEGFETIAVFPFENIRKDKNVDWLSNGFAETLTYKLSQVTTLKVVDRLQILRALQDTQTQQAGIIYDIQAAKKMDTSFVLSGSYTVYGDSIQVITRLVEVKSGMVRPLVQEQYPLSNLRVMQTDVANKIIAIINKKETDIP